MNCWKKLPFESFLKGKKEDKTAHYFSYLKLNSASNQTPSYCSNEGNLSSEELCDSFALFKMKECAKEFFCVAVALLYVARRFAELKLCLSVQVYCCFSRRTFKFENECDLVDELEV
jgi:hypothetical protein